MKDIYIKLVDFLSKKSPFMVEFFIYDSKSDRIELDNNSISGVTTSIGSGIGVRVIDKKGRIAFAHTGNPDIDKVKKSYETAIENIAFLSEDNPITLPGQPGKTGPKSYSKSIKSISVEKKIELAEAAREGAVSFDKRICRVRKALYQDSYGEVAILNSNGLNVLYPFSRVYSMVETVAKDETDAQIAYYSDFAYSPKDINFSETGRKSAEMAVGKLGAAQIATGKYDAIVAPEVTAQIIGSLASSLSGESVFKKTSLFEGLLMQRVASDAVSLLDDGTLIGGYGTRPCDDEGIPSSRNLFIEDGILKGYAHNIYSAMKMNELTTGNASRGSYSSPPSIGFSTLLFKPGNMNQSQMISTMGHGIMIEEVMGLHTINPVTGRFSLASSGHEIKKGKIGKPFRGVGISGNLLEFLSSIEAVGSDLHLFAGSSSGSSILIRNISVGGK